MVLEAAVLFVFVIINVMFAYCMGYRRGRIEAKLVHRDELTNLIKGYFKEMGDARDNAADDGKVDQRTDLGGGTKAGDCIG